MNKEKFCWERVLLAQLGRYLDERGGKCGDRATREAFVNVAECTVETGQSQLHRQSTSATRGSR